ncbi:MAG: sodium:solute symporter [Flavobacteriales bacterium]|jgi:SSS family transporter|nr:MAG: sodium:solute symporter [Flavobacteriales bacterium]
MSPSLVLSVILAYFGLLYLISVVTSRGAGNSAFFLGERRSPWYVVAFGMIGASLSGVTFISVPGMVGQNQFSYLQMVLGYLPGYAVIAFVLMPLYYRLGLTSIYGYLGQRFGRSSYLTGAWFFLLSRSVGSAARLYLVAEVLQYLLFDAWGVPFLATVVITIALIWLYTHRGGMRTIIWTDTLQTAFMLLAVGLTVVLLGERMGWGIGETIAQVKASPLSRVFFFDDPKPGTYFWKQFLGGMFIAIAMTGLDQDMMQKNLSCRSIGEAQKNMVSFSLVLVGVNLVFLALGALLFLYVERTGIALPPKADQLYPMLAVQGGLPILVGLLFLLGLIAAAYSSADSALTALTTSVCVDVLGIDRRPEGEREPLRKRVHVLMSVLMVVLILLFKALNDDSIIKTVFKVAGYTYGPLLGLFAYGMLISGAVRDRWVPLVALLSPVITYLIDRYSTVLFAGYSFGFELLLLNGALTFAGLLLLRVSGAAAAPSRS